MNGRVQEGKEVDGRVQMGKEVEWKRGFRGKAECRISIYFC